MTTQASPRCITDRATEPSAAAIAGLSQHHWMQLILVMQKLMQRLALL